MLCDDPRLETALSLGKRNNGCALIRQGKHKGRILPLKSVTAPGYSAVQRHPSSELEQSHQRHGFLFSGGSQGGVPQKVSESLHA